MTYLELYMSKHPDMSKEDIINTRCPDCEYADDCEYVDAVRYEGCTYGNDYEDCLDCWNREISEACLKYLNRKTPEENNVGVSITHEGIERVMKILNDEPGEPHILDSGNRREFETGAVRDIQEGKGRCDLLPLDVVAEITGLSTFEYIACFVESGETRHLERILEMCPKDGLFPDIPTMILEVAKQFEEGAKKYGEDNWQKGIPVRCYIDSAVRHYLKYLRGDKDEPHDRAFVWNLMCAIWTCKHKPELNNYKKED